MNTLQNTPIESPLVVDIIDELKRHLSQPSPRYPRDIINQMLQQQEYVTPKLLEMLEHFVSSLPRDSDSPEWIEGVTALFVLSKFRETRAFPLVVRLCSLPYQTLEKLMGDITTEHLNSFLASTFNGDWDTLYSLVSNQHLNQYARSATLKAFIILYKYNVISRDKLIDTLRRLFDELVHDFSFAPSALVLATCDIGAVELRSQINQYFQHWIIDLEFIDEDDVKRSLDRSQKEVLKDLQTDRFPSFVDNLEDEMGWLFCEKESDDDDDEEEEEEDLYQKILRLESMNDVLETKKIGRNAPCPCDSGKKYKKCCLEGEKGGIALDNSMDDMPF